MLIREIENRIESINNLEAVHGRTRSSKKIVDSLKREIKNIRDGERKREMSLVAFLQNQDEINPHKMTNDEYDSLVNFF